MRRACILAGPLLLALAALVTAESCDAPTLCRRYVSPAPKIIGIGSQKAQPPRADLPSRHGRPPPPSPRSPVCKKPQVSKVGHADGYDRRWTAALGTFFSGAGLAVPVPQRLPGGASPGRPLLSELCARPAAAFWDLSPPADSCRRPRP